MSGYLEDLVVVSNLAPLKDRPEYETVDGSYNVQPQFPTKLPTELVERNLKKAIEGITHYLNSIEMHDGPFVLEEAEMFLQVDQSGKVHVFVADVGASLSSGLRFRWKRRHLTEG